MDTILVKCDSVIAEMTGNAVSCPASIECAGTNCYDVCIAGIICGTVVILALFMLIAFWARLHRKEICPNKQEGNSDEKKTTASNEDKDKNEANDNDKGVTKLEERFLSFCENHIKDNDSLQGDLFRDYKKVLSKHIDVLEDKKEDKTPNDKPRRNEKRF